MKKLFILISFILIASTAQAGWIASVANSDLPEVKPESKYELDTYGFDVRIYEWTPKDNKNVRCVLAAGNENSSGVACYEVQPSKKK